MRDDQGCFFSRCEVLLPFNEFNTKFTYRIIQIETKQDPLGVVDCDVGLPLLARRRVGRGKRVIPGVTVHVCLIDGDELSDGQRTK